MIFRAILIVSYLLLRSAFKIATLIDSSFKRRLMERDVAFVVESRTNDVVGLFRLEEGNLCFSNKVDGSVDFRVVWNGWGSADTLRKKIRLNIMDFLNKGMITLAGDLSCIDYFLVLLGKMIGCFRKKQPARLRRAGPGKEPS